MKQIISNGPSKEYEFHGVSRFTDVLCAINVDNEFLTSFINIYPKLLDLKVEHLGNHASFLDLGVKRLFSYMNSLTKVINSHSL